MTDTPKIQTINVADIEIPPQFAGLYELAYNLWWSWTPRARRLFNAIDPGAWSAYRNPVQLLINVDPDEWESLLQNDSFQADYHSLLREFRRSMDNPQTWFARTQEPIRGPVAYFSCEYGLHECFNIYSGGLGVLSGDHLKSASQLGLPFVGVGLLYRRGYFRQAVDAEGRQQHNYPNYDFHRLPVRPVAGPTSRTLTVEVELPGRMVTAKVWLAQVGRIPLLLLDTDVPANDPADRPITGILYVRGRDMRLAQEMVLGIGGAKALAALGITPSVWHLNEGHSAFLLLERMRAETDARAALGDRLAALRPSTVFTTHTPVPAGNEVFDRELAAKYVAPWASVLSSDPESALALGQVGGDEGFNLTALAMRGASVINAVSQLHADVSNQMWQQPLGLSRPIVGITNGVHTGTWLGEDLRELLNRQLGTKWTDDLLDVPKLRQQLGGLPDADLWAAHRHQKRRLAGFVRERVRTQWARHGRSPDELRQVEELFDSDALTIGFARRFATYKRASLLFQDLARLTRIVADPDRPVQILLSGKAHPADQPGQALIQHIFELTQSPELAGRVFFLEDYDLEVGRHLVQGVDVWLNTPRRPMEASGTSGQKAGANGVLNLSVLDGWWPEAHDQVNGWAIGTDAHFDREDLHDAADATALYEILETQVVPDYYRRDPDGIPREWVNRMRDSIATILPQFSSHRMVRDYVDRCYRPRARTSPDPQPTS